MFTAFLTGIAVFIGRIGYLLAKAFLSLATIIILLGIVFAADYIRLAQ